MPVTLTITDAQNGSAATATVAGSSATDTNTLFKAAWTGNLGTLTFTSVGVRTGDGTIPVTTGVGYWLWLLESVTSANLKTVVLVYQNTTDATATGDPVMYRAMLAVQTQIRALALAGISNDNVVVKWLPRALDNNTDPMPAIEICPAPLPENMPQDLTGTDKLHYPVLVTMIAAQNQDYDDFLSRNLKWRELISREFRYQPLVGIPEIIHCLPEPKAIIDPQWFAKNLYYSAMVWRFVSRETRGN